MEKVILEMISRICDEEIDDTQIDFDLIDSGLLDSLGRVEFIVAIEEEFGIIIQPTEIDWNEINTARKIIDFIIKHMGRQ